MQEAIAETLGLMVYFIVNKVGSLGQEEDLSENMAEAQSQQRELLDQQFFKMAFTLLEKSPNKAV